MCTVTFLPTRSGFILTHNRDEAPARSPQTLVRAQTPQGQGLLFPRDVKAGGTWIASSPHGRTACILNGAFVRHTHLPPYRRSRGLMLLDFFDWENPDEFFQRYDFEGMEPFTFLFFESRVNKESAARVLECRWDEQLVHLKELSGQEPHFWCSATLYPADMQVRRAQIFQHWLAQIPPGTNPSPPQILQLHLTGSVGDPENDFVMSRGGRVQTVSVTQAILDEKKVAMRYLDLLGGNRSARRMQRKMG